MTTIRQRPVVCANCGAKMTAYDWQTHRCLAAASDDEVTAGCVVAEINALHLLGTISTRIADAARGMISPEFVTENPGLNVTGLADLIIDLARLEIRNNS